MSLRTPLSDEQYAADSARADRCLEQHRREVGSQLLLDRPQAVLREDIIVLDVFVG